MGTPSGRCVMLGMGAGYTFLLLAIVVWGLTVCVQAIVGAWRARGVARENTRRAEIQAQIKRAKADEKMVMGWVPPAERKKP